MTYIDLTLPTPAENLACDEALLDFCENTNAPEVLRTWESQEYFVVVGYANKVDTEVNRESCAANRVPILRRCSGGGTVLQGSGCFNYSLILNYARNESLGTITRANHHIMEKHSEMLQKCFREKIEVQGHTDLTIDGVKFSGNAQRRKKNHLLFHGTFLVDFNISLIEQLLKMPSHQPEYRKERSHSQFLTNIRLSRTELVALLRKAWGAGTPAVAPFISSELIEKYRSAEWNFKF